MNCSHLPIYIDIHQRHVHGSDSLEYDTPVGFGSPAQNQSLFPSLTHNETSVADVDLRRESNLTNRSNGTGGFFQPDESRTWKADKAYKSTDINSSSEDAVFGSDTVHLYTHFFQTEPVSETTVDNFPLKVISNGSAVPGKLGLGPQSTLLTKLYDDSLISSRSFGLYVGNGSPQTKGSIVNGSLTLGGYDSKRFTGGVYKYTLDSSGANPFRVHVKQIILHDDGGEVQNVSLVKGDGFDAQITTDQYALSLPADVTRAYADALDAATPSGDADSSFRINNKPFNGTMSVILSTGFTVKRQNISWSNAVVAGRQQNLNRSNDDNGRGPEQFYLGNAWLSQVYLVANYDDNTFHLAQAVQDTDFVSLQTLCPGDVPRPYADPDTSSFAKRGLVGAVIGGVGAAILLLYLGVWIYASYREARRRMKTVHWFKGTNKSMEVPTFDEGDEMIAMMHNDDKVRRDSS
ncbi:hypothetical protein VTN00DRAFT_6293 [Thermoascus crustaceus]|uniref:uncharacterized protein n=1 Tax=Thermoascus crustaceus TaxID=5088 RepID=UPI0037433CD8